MRRENDAKTATHIPYQVFMGPPPVSIERGVLLAPCFNEEEAPRGPVPGPGAPADEGQGPDSSQLLRCPPELGQWHRAPVGTGQRWHRDLALAWPAALVGQGPSRPSCGLKGAHSPDPRSVGRGRALGGSPACKVPGSVLGATAQEALGPLDSQEPPGSPGAGVQGMELARPQFRSQLCLAQAGSSSEGPLSPMCAQGGGPSRCLGVRVRTK